MRIPSLDRLPLAWLVAWRYLRGERSQILSSTAFAALGATSLGVTAMIIAMALMSGYTSNLQRTLVSLQGDVVVSPLRADRLDEGRELLTNADIESVVFVGRVAYGEGSISSPKVPEGVSVSFRGIEAGSSPKLLDSDELMVDLSPRSAVSDTQDSDAGVIGVLMGSELVRQLGITKGDPVRLVILRLEERVRFRYRSARLVGTFTTGFAEFDSSWALIDRQMLIDSRGDAGLDVLEVKLTPDADRAAASDQLATVLGEDWHVQRWETLNGELFAALELQEAMLFLVLGLIVVVSTFNTASTLLILVRERINDIGVLASLGLEPRQLWWVFVTYGMGLGMLGITVGVVLGTSISFVVTHFKLIRFPPEVAEIYFIDSVPFLVEARDLLAIVTFSLVVTFLACSLPALRAATLRPSDALRDA